MPTRFAGKAATQTMYPALESAARELASDNIMCAVMLTGVLFLQVRFSHLLFQALVVLTTGRTILLENGNDQGKNQGSRIKSSGSSVYRPRASAPYIHAVQGIDGRRGDGIEGIK
jgi:hypothetical protein